MSKFKIIILLIFMVLSLSGCEKKENHGKEVLHNNDKSLIKSKEVSIKDALDIVDGKCILIDSDNSLYPTIVSFGRDYYIEYIKDSDGPSYEVLEVSSDDKKVTYNVESSYYDEPIEYKDIAIELIDENTIKYIGERESLKSYNLMSKTEVALYMKEYTEKVENGLTIEDKKEDYIIDDSNIRLLDKSELSSYTKKELAYIRNEIFARHGYIFKSDEYNEYFSGKYWYNPDPNFDGDINSLSEIEKANLDLIKELEGEN